MELREMWNQPVSCPALKKNWQWNCDQGSRHYMEDERLLPLHLQEKHWTWAHLVPLHTLCWSWLFDLNLKVIPNDNEYCCTLYRTEAKKHVPVMGQHKNKNANNTTGTTMCHKYEKHFEKFSRKDFFLWEKYHTYVYNWIWCIVVCCISVPHQIGYCFQLETLFTEFPVDKCMIWNLQEEKLQ